MARSIVIPLYPHTPDAEIADLLEELRRIGIDGAQVVHSYIGEEEVPPPCGHDDGWVVGCSRCESDRKLADALIEARESVTVRPRMLEAVPEHEEDPDRVARILGQPDALEVVRALPVRERGRRVEIVRPRGFRDHAEEIGYHRSIEILKLASEPIDGRPGWRVDREGREWYSSEWLDRGVAS